MPAKVDVVLTSDDNEPAKFGAKSNTLTWKQKINWKIRLTLIENLF